MNGKSLSPPHTIRPPVSGGSSPHNRQKRTDDESYIPNQMAHSTSPHQSEILTRSSTAPDQDMLQHIAAQPSLEQNRSGALCSERAVASSTTTTTTTTSTPKPDSLGVSATPKVENARTFLDAMDDFQDQLNEEYRLFEQKLKQGDQDVELEDFDWEQLEARYHAKVDPIVESEQAIMNDCSRLFQHFLLWMQMSSEREAERALKRLRTRVAFVQNSEGTLQEKKAHYTKVVNAFHSAMALLGNI